MAKNNKHEETHNIKKTNNQLTEEEKESRKLIPESLLSKARRYVLSFQALLSAKKVWILIGIAKLIYLKVLRRRYQIIITSSPPVAVNVLGLVAQSLFNAKWILDLRDPISQWEDTYPECISAARVKLEEWIEKLCLEKSDLILVTTPSYKSELDRRIDLQSLKGKIILLYNGYDGPLMSYNNKINENNRLNIVYAGSLYMNRDPFPFLRAIKKLILNDKKNITVNFYGSCSSWNGIEIKKWLVLNNIESYVVLHGNVESDELDQIYQDADILLVFAQGQPKQIPGKIFEYLPYSATILAITEKNSDSAKLLNTIQASYIEESVEEKIQETLLHIEKSRMTCRNSEEIRFYSREYQNKLLINECVKFNNDC